MSKSLLQSAWRAFICVVILCLISLVSAATAERPSGELTREGAGVPARVVDDPKCATGELLVRFHENAPQSLRAAAHVGVGAAVVQAYHLVPHLYRVQLLPGRGEQEAVAAYQKKSGVLYAHCNGIVKALGGPNIPPNDPLFQQLWGLQNMGQQGGI